MVIVIQCQTCYFRPVKVVPTYDGYPPNFKDQYLISGVDCIGNEESLQHCTMNHVGETFCGKTGKAGVICDDGSSKFYTFSHYFFNLIIYTE